MASLRQGAPPAAPSARMLGSTRSFSASRKLSAARASRSSAAISGRRDRASRIRGADVAERRFESGRRLLDELDRGPSSYPRTADSTASAAFWLFSASRQQQLRLARGRPRRSCASSSERSLLSASAWTRSATLLALRRHGLAATFRSACALEGVVEHWSTARSTISRRWPSTVRRRPRRAARALEARFDVRPKSVMSWLTATPPAARS